MINKKILINMSVLFLGVNSSYGFESNNDYQPTANYFELVKKYPTEKRNYRDCLSVNVLTDCEKSYCLMNTKLNRSEKYYDVLLEYQLLCSERSVRAGIILQKELWEAAGFDLVNWDQDGPPLIAIEKEKYGTEKEKSKSRLLSREKVTAIDNYFQILKSKWQHQNIQIKDYKVKKGFYQFLLANPYKKRTYKTCLGDSQLDACEQSLCMAMTKLNKTFNYYKVSSKPHCHHPEISEAVGMKGKQWLYDNGRSPSNWDHEGAPEHVLKIMID